MKTMQDRCKELIGSSLVVRDKNYGVIEDFFVISDNYDIRCILVTDNGANVDAGSYFRYLATTRTVVHYPDGADYAARLRLPVSHAKSGIKYIPTKNLSNIAHVNYKGENKRGGN